MIFFLLFFFFKKLNLVIFSEKVYTDDINERYFGKFLLSVGTYAHWGIQNFFFFVAQLRLWLELL